MSRTWQFTASVLVVAVSSLLTLVALEFAVRLAVPAFDPSGHVRIVSGEGKRPNLGQPNSLQRQIKNTGDFDVDIRFNKYGFRDDRDLADSTEDDYFAVGDSISFGWGVVESARVTEQLEKLIGKRVFNISIPGNLDVSEKLVKYAQAKGAKINNLIIFFGTEVRLRDYDAPPTAPVAPRVRNPSPVLTRIKNRLTETSALYFLITWYVHHSPALKNLAIRAGLIRPNLGGFPIHQYDAKVIYSTARRLARFGNQGFRRLIVVVLPMRTLWIGPSQETEDKIWRTLLGQLRDKGLDVVDLRPDFEAGGDPFRYFFKNDGHWNPEGHALAARAVARHMKK